MGVDPGASGGVAWIDCHGDSEAWSLDTKDLTLLRTTFDPVLAAWEAGYEVTVGLEDVHGRGGWGARQTFSFGGSFWVAKSFLLDEGYDVQLIKPTRWQTEILGAGIRAPRNKTDRKQHWVDAAVAKWPGFDYTSGQADAMWLAFTAAVDMGWVSGKGPA